MVSNSDRITEIWKNQSKPESIPSWNRRLGKFVYDYLYHDMLLSGCDVTLANVKSAYERNEISDYTGNIKTVYMLDNNSEFMFGMLRSLTKEESIDTRLIRRINKSLTKNILEGKKYNIGERPGEWRKETCTFGDGKVGCNPDKVNSRMLELTEMMAAPQSDPLLVAAVSHCLFQNVHPFADGNGRTGRALTNYYLMSRNIPPIIFHNEYKSMYFNALGKFDADKTNAFPMYEYMELMQEMTWKDTEEEVSMLDTLAKLKERTEG